MVYEVKYFPASNKLTAQNSYEIEEGNGFMDLIRDLKSVKHLDS